MIEGDHRACVNPTDHLAAFLAGAATKLPTMICDGTTCLSPSTARIATDRSGATTRTLAGYATHDRPDKPRRKRRQPTERRRSTYREKRSRAGQCERCLLSSLLLRSASFAGYKPQAEPLSLAIYGVLY